MILGKYEVRFQHNVEEKISKCYIFENKNKVEHIIKGISKCGKSDTFSRKKGRLVAFERAVKEIPSKVDRTLLWNDFFNKFPGAKAVK